jgi:hypothetical protein
MAVIASRSEDPAAIARTTADSTTFQPTRRDVEGATVIAGTGLPLVDAFLAEQWSLIGTCEQPCGSDNAPPITTWYGIGDVPWCAETQSYALHMVGYERSASVLSLRRRHPTARPALLTRRAAGGRGPPTRCASHRMLRGRRTPGQGPACSRW